MEVWQTIAAFLMIAGAILLIVGSALIWNAFHKHSSLSGPLYSAVQYGNLCFVFLGMTAIIYYFIGRLDMAGRSVWRFLFYGLVLYTAVLSIVNNVQSVDDYRYADSKDTGFSTLSAEGVHKMLGAEIIAYTGLVLVALLIDGPFKFRFNLALLFYLVAIALAIVGIVILWNLHANQHAGGSAAARDDIFTITITLIVTLAVLGGSIIHEQIDGAHAACFIIGLYGVWYLGYGFALKDAEQSGNLGNSEINKSWAGSLFCWFSAFVAFISARFAVARPVTSEAQS
jgi:hypothetical protein